VDVDETDDRGCSALMWAAGGGYLDICKLLVEHNASVVCEKQIDGRHPLHYAARNGEHFSVCVCVERERDCVCECVCELQL
jgi:ankyrin repeat protein